MPDYLLEQLRALPVQATDEVWEVGYIKLPSPNGDPSLPASQTPIVPVCVSNRGGVATSQPSLPSQLPSSALLDALSKFALHPLIPGARPLGYLPSRVHTPRRASEADTRFAETLAALGVIVEVKPDLPELDRFAQFMNEQALAFEEDGGGQQVHARGLMESKGMTIDRVRAFADAAAEFLAAKPWTRFPHEVLWRSNPKPKTAALSHFTIMGGAGEVFGLGFLSSPRQLEAMAFADSPMEYLRTNNLTQWSVMFEPRAEIPLKDAELWSVHKFSARGERGYPLPLGVTSTGRLVRPTPAQLNYLELVLRAATKLTDADRRKGSRAFIIPTHDGTLELTLTVAVDLREMMEQ
jgi:hypothetical protein